MPAFDPIPYLHGVTTDKAGIAALFGETLQTVDSWVRRGCPCQRSGGVRSPLTFDTAQVIAWRTIADAHAAGGERAARAVRLQFEKMGLEAELARRSGGRRRHD